MPADPATLAFFGILALIAVVMHACRWWTFTRMPRPEGREGEVVYTYSRRYKLVSPFESPIDGRTTGWEAVDDYGNPRYFSADLYGCRRAG